MFHRSIVALLLASSLSACSQSAPAPEAPLATTAAAAPPTLSDPASRAYPGLENVVAYAPRVYSGSVPHGAPGFRTLQAWGVETVISVDGARPDIEAARAAGLRYVHLPIGYDGMSEERTLEIARALSLARERGAVYLHCHHGKHRSAGAAGAATVTLGWRTPVQATARMKVSGTSPRYPGLYRIVALAKPASTARLDALPTTFPQVSEPQGLIKSMVAIERTFDHLRKLRAAGWRAPTDHPDLVPAAEAGRLTDLFRTLDTQGRPADFQRWTRDSQRLASQIEEDLVAGKTGPALGTRLKQIRASCTACHASYRNR